MNYDSSLSLDAEENAHLWEENKRLLAELEALKALQTVTQHVLDNWNTIDRSVARTLLSVAVSSGRNLAS
jgi:hypothetical protein